MHEAEFFVHAEPVMAKTLFTLPCYRISGKQHGVGEKGVLLPAWGRLMPGGSAGDPGGWDGQRVFQDAAQVALAEVVLVRERKKASCVEGQGAVGAAVAGQQAARHDAGPGGRLGGGEVLAAREETRFAGGTRWIALSCC